MAPLAHSLGDGAICAVPMLELTAQVEREQVERLLQVIRSVIEREPLLPGELQPTHAIAFDWTSEFRAAQTPGAALDWMQSELTKGSHVAIRQGPTTVAVAGALPAANQFTTPTETLRVTLGRNYFPDDAAVVTLNCTSAAPTAWSTMASLRDSLLALLGPAFCWSTLGYGFVCDINRVSAATAQMEFMCMRYLGVDLQDPYGGYAWLQARGMQSVNWQVCMAPDWLAALASTDAAVLTQSGTPHQGAVLWRACDAPSLCDRNDPRDHPAIAAYAALDAQLASVVSVPRLPWFPRWNESTTERWSNRWREVST